MEQEANWPPSSSSRLVLEDLEDGERERERESKRERERGRGRKRGKEGKGDIGREI